MNDYVFVSVDVEYTGPSPANGELLSIGCCTVDAESYEIGRSKFSINLKTPFGLEDPNTMQWWQTQPKAWEIHRQEQVNPVVAMPLWLEWLESLQAKPIFVAWPVGADWNFTNYYLWQITGQNPFGYSPMCLKNYALGVLRRPQGLLGNREEAQMPDNFVVTPESLGLTSHIALDDAIAQAHMLVNILQY
jgi:hypothetical protein